MSTRRSRFAIAVVDDSGTIRGRCDRFTSRQRMLNHGGYTAEVRRVCTKDGGSKGLLLHVVFHLLESMESHGVYQDNHLHFAVRIGNVTQGVRLEEGDEISRE